MKKSSILIAAAAALTAFAAPASATLVVNLTGGTSAIPDDNDFQADLAALSPSLTQFATSYTVSVENAPVYISVYRVASESGLTNWVEVEGTQYNETENSWNIDDLLVTFTQTTNSLSGVITFGSLGESGVYELGTDHVGVFLPVLDGFTYSSNELFFGFNDDGSPDGDYDDYIIRITSGAIPEPATWAMMMIGLGLVGASLRRRRTTVSFV